VLGVLVALAGAVTALWQTRLQLFPDPSLECSYTDPNLIERIVDWLGMQWPELFLATGLCSSKEWELFGLSMANWSALMFLLLAGMLGWVARRGAAERR
jgi:disulfide bond formation protein DsbB